MKISLRRCVLVASLALVSCTAAPEPAAETAPLRAPTGAVAARGPAPSALPVTCAQSRQGILRPPPMLEVADVWPRSSSAVFGYAQTVFDRTACSQARRYQGTTAPAPACGLAFPWLDLPAPQSESLLGATGVVQRLTGFLRGHDPMPAGAVVAPQELRETVLWFTDADTAGHHFLLEYARACGQPMASVPGTAFRTTTHSQDTADPITALLAVRDSALVWLEFDDGGWQEPDYRHVLQLALAAAHRR